MAGLYNRYSGNTGRYVRVDDDFPGEHRQAPAPQSREAARTSPAREHTQRAAKLPGFPAPGENLFSGLLGKLEPADLLLIAVVLLLYLEKKDDDLLITLAALVMLSLG